MRSCTKIDWSAVRAFHRGAVVAGDNGSPLTRETRLYWYVRKYARTHNKSGDWQASWDHLINLAEEFDLSPLNAARLYRRLQNEAGRMGLNTTLEALADAGDFLKNLNDIRAGLSKLAGWSGEMLSKDRPERMSIAETHLENAAYKWVKSTLAGSAADGHELVLRQGFELPPSAPGNPDFGQMPAVRRWLANNVLFFELLQTTITSEEKRRRTDQRERREWEAASKKRPALPPERMPKRPTEYMNKSRPGAKVRLSGLILPSLYEEFTEREFGLTKKGDEVQDTAGVRFVRLSMLVMGLLPPGAEGIASNWKKMSKNGRVTPPQKQ